MIVTACPSSEYRVSVPAQPDSGSSGCPPTQTTFSLRAAPDSDSAAASGSEFAARIAGAAKAADCFIKSRRVRSCSCIGLLFGKFHRRLALNHHKCGRLRICLGSAMPVFISVLVFMELNFEVLRE